MIKCCNNQVEIHEAVEHNGGMGIGIYCPICQNKATGETKEDAIKAFKPTIIKESPPMNNNPSNLPAVKQLDSNHLMQIASPVMGSTGAVERLMKNNVRYVKNLQGDNWNKIWNTNPGSIVHATEEAMILGAELGKMGDLVPYGTTCEFIPSIEAYEFALTNGKNAPFENLEIECIHENDERVIGRKNGDFHLDLNMGCPRGDVVAIAVYGRYKDGSVKGELYDAERLLEKAKEHSSSYKQYATEKIEIEHLRSEGKLQSKNGREYYNKLIEYTKNGQKKSFNKDVFIDDLSNPYDGADLPEMLRKVAGKSFCRKYARVRNAEAAADEVRTHKQAVNKAMNMTDDILEGNVQ